jgi:hypothetical protein
VTPTSVSHRRRRRQDSARPAVFVDSVYPPQPGDFDNTGHFEFNKLSEGKYTIEIVADGFETRTIEGIAAGIHDLKVVLTKTTK